MYCCSLLVSSATVARQVRAVCKMRRYSPSTVAPRCPATIIRTSNTTEEKRRTGGKERKCNFQNWKVHFQQTKQTMEKRPSSAASGGAPGKKAKSTGATAAKAPKPVTNEPPKAKAKAKAQKPARPSQSSKGPKKQVHLVARVCATCHALECNAFLGRRSLTLLLSRLPPYHLSQDEGKTTSNTQSKLTLSKKSANPAERREVTIAGESNTAILCGQDGDVLFKNIPDRPVKL